MSLGGGDQGVCDYNTKALRITVWQRWGRDKIRVTSLVGVPSVKMFLLIFLEK